MSWTYPSTIDAAPRLAILPDWSAGIGQTTTYRTDINRSRRGLEQRSARARRPILTMEYQWTSSDAAARRRIEDVIAQTRGPVTVPWWPHGVTLREPMTVETSLALDSAFIEYEQDQVGWVYLWHRTAGAEWRQIAAISGAVLTLVDTGTHILFPTGAFCFPAFAATREAAQNVNQAATSRTVDEILTFRTL